MQRERVLAGFVVLGVSVAAIAKGPFFSAIGAPTTQLPPRYELSLAGMDQGSVVAPSGGDAVTAAVQTKMQAVAGRTTYTPIVFRVGPPVGQQLFMDMQSAFSGQSKRLDGTITTADFDGNVQSVQEFKDGLITSVAFPKLDGSSKDAARITVQVSPESVRVKSGVGSKLGNAVDPKTAQWMTSSFRLQVDGLDTTHVSSIDPVVVTIPAAAGANGTLTPGPVSPTTLSFRIPGADEAGYVAAQKAGGSKNAILVFLKPDLKTEIFELRFQGLQLTKIAHETSATNVQMVTSRVTLAPPSP